jgi:uncharacterized membrane protein
MRFTGSNVAVWYGICEFVPQFGACWVVCAKVQVSNVKVGSFFCGRRKRAGIPYFCFIETTFVFQTRTLFSAPNTVP